MKSGTPASRMPDRTTTTSSPGIASSSSTSRTSSAPYRVARTSRCPTGTTPRRIRPSAASCLRNSACRPIRCIPPVPPRPYVAREQRAADPQEPARRPDGHQRRHGVHELQQRRHGAWASAGRSTRASTARSMSGRHRQEHGAGSRMRRAIRCSGCTTSNIDRLWAHWNHNGGTNPTTAAWAKKIFVFADGQGQRVTGGAQGLLRPVDAGLHL